MGDFVIDMGLRSQGFNDEQIARIEATIPKYEYVLAWIKNNKTVLNELIDVTEMITKQMALHQKGQ